MSPALDGPAPREYAPFMPDRRGAHDSAADTTLANGPKGRFEPGQRIGPYEIVRSLGKGAMGTVVVARHTDLGREVALKVLSHAAAVDAESVERFRRESEATARLKHANIVGMYERGEADGFHYYAMELISGVSLEDVMKRERVSYIEAARIMSQIAHAIDYAHGQGVLHRDLKPANILLDDSGRPRVTDFGLARMNQKATLTSDGIVVGTPLYLAPEVARGGRGSRQSDIYSLGATLYELASGKPPYPGLDARTVLLRVLAEPPAAPTVVDPRMPADLVRVIAKAMARDPAERYANARQLAVDLDRFVQGRALEIGGSAEAWKERPAARHARSAGLLVLSLAALACVIALFVDERAKRRALEREKKEREAKLRTRPPEDHGLTDKDAVGVRALEVRDDRARAALASLPDDAADPLARGLFDERLSRAHEAAADN
ncbi:serine/threonine protein kinase, partial [bacterium]|nr:serine/threonine protein kinase [bacterium]